MITSVVAAAFGVLGALAGIIALRRYQSSAAMLRAELYSTLGACKLEICARVEELGREVENLEMRSPITDEVGKTGLNRSARAQAMRLLRCGTTPESAAATLGMGSREMRLIARVCGTLSTK
jgi:hypothetical protein